MTKPIFSLLVALMLLAGCGQKGPLYLENAGVDAASTESVAEDAAAVEEEQTDEEADSATTSE